MRKGLSVSDVLVHFNVVGHTDTHHTAVLHFRSVSFSLRPLQERAGYIRPVQLHNGGGRPGVPALLRGGGLRQRRASGRLLLLLLHGSPSPSRRSPRVPCPHCALGGPPPHPPGGGGWWWSQWKPWRKPLYWRLGLLPPFHFLLLLLFFPTSRRNGAGPPGPLHVLLVVPVVVGPGGGAPPQGCV